MKKFTNEGKGAPHSRFFWVNPSNTRVSSYLIIFPLCLLPPLPSVSSVGLQAKMLAPKILNQVGPCLIRDYRSCKLCLFLLSDILVGVRSSASPAIFGRADFDPLDKHKYAYTIFTSNR